MKRIATIFTIVALALIMVMPRLGFTGESETVLKVKGMTCSTCEGKVVQALQSVKSVKSAEADWRKGEVRIVLASDNVDKLALQKAVKKAGFQMDAGHAMGGKEMMHTNIIKIKGMTCNDCENKVQEALLKVDGVKSVEVDYKSGEAKVMMASDNVSKDALNKAIKDAGFQAMSLNPASGGSCDTDKDKKMKKTGTKEKPSHGSACGTSDKK